MRIYWLLAAWVTMAAALPSGPRDMEVDDEPFYSDLEPGLDLIAEESATAELVTLPAPIEMQNRNNRTEKERSLMLVMPLTPSNSTHLEELYTQRPETRLVETTTAVVTQAPITLTKSTVVVHSVPPKRLPTPVHISLPPPAIRPDIKDLLASIGLQPAAMPTTTPPPPTESFSLRSRTCWPMVPSADVSSYSSFKPIPDQLNVDDEMKDLLAQYGLVDRKTSSRQLTTAATPPAKEDEEETTTEHPDFKIRPKEQAVTEPSHQIPTLHPHSMTNEMKRVLFDLGLAPHISAEEIAEGNNQAPGSLPELLERSSSNQHEFVFNPTDVSPLNDTMEEKLKDILNNFKLNQDDKEEQALRLISKYRKSTLNQNDGPDPLSNDELVSDFSNFHNEVHKRQNKDAKDEASDSENSTASTTTSTTTSSSAGAEEKETSTEGGGPSIADLESSFGGSGDEVPDETLPPPKPNGFYFLLDLNTFLNVGEDDKGVHLRLAPRLGNSKNFLPITVP
ncbi:Hypothetical predicted protein [Cloeon dipterum]|uniref:Uncharacterized protein n=1 Tax=Cloeon dipterum TaxID=197152 RepID=A0A8S1D9L5_9INSE|nr:Hypothetical predicted protein [Cloeon dipterum]